MGSPVNRERSLSVAEFLSRLDVCYQHQSGVVQSAGSGDLTGIQLRKAKEASPWAQCVLGHLGRLLWMEDADGSPKAGSKRMLEVFRHFDEDGNGLLERGEFAKAVKALLAEYKDRLPAAIWEETASDEHIR